MLFAPHVQTTVIELQEEINHQKTILQKLRHSGCCSDADLHKHKDLQQKISRA